MRTFPPTIVIRHPKERLSKCSLRGLESRGDFQFVKYESDAVPSLDGYVRLEVGAPPLGADRRSL